MPLFKLGDVIFDATSTTAPETVDLEDEWQWAVIERILNGPARQFMGPGESKVIFAGVSFSAYGNNGGPGLIQQIRSMGDAGQPYTLIDARGNVWGQYCILDLKEVRGPFLANSTPRKQTFHLTLVLFAEAAV